MRPLSKLHYIIVHHTATPEDTTVEEIRREHVEGNGWADIGYHFLVNKIGLMAGRNIHEAGAHALGEKVTGIFSPNQEAIGIAIIGSFEVNPPSHKLVNEVAYGLRVLCKKYKIQMDGDHIMGHSDVDFTACPGKDTMELIFKALGI